MNNSGSMKIYVGINVSFDELGRMIPHELIWEDGKVFRIDKVSEIQMSNSMRSGGSCDRYTVWLGRRKRFLYFERSFTRTGCVGRWFIEKQLAG